METDINLEKLIQRKDAIKEKEVPLNHILTEILLPIMNYLDDFLQIDENSEIKDFIDEFKNISRDLTNNIRNKTVPVIKLDMKNPLHIFLHAYLVNGSDELIKEIENTKKNFKDAKIILKASSKYIYLEPDMKNTAYGNISVKNTIAKVINQNE